MQIEKIIYQTTREIYRLEDKLSITTLFLFCEKLGSKTFAELLYTNNHQEFIDKLNKEYQDYDIDLSVRLDDKNVNNSYFKTLEKVKEVEDKDGYYKALYERDPYALVIADICSYQFNKIEFKKLTENIQLKLEL